MYVRTNERMSERMNEGSFIRTYPRAFFLSVICARLWRRVLSHVCAFANCRRARTTASSVFSYELNSTLRVFWTSHVPFVWRFFKRTEQAHWCKYENNHCATSFAATGGMLFLHCLPCSNPDFWATQTRRIHFTLCSSRHFRSVQRNRSDWPPLGFSNDKQPPHRRPGCRCKSSHWGSHSFHFGQIWPFGSPFGIDRSPSKATIRYSQLRVWRCQNFNLVDCGPLSTLWELHKWYQYMRKCKHCSAFFPRMPSKPRLLRKCEPRHQSCDELQLSVCFLQRRRYKVSSR